MSQTFKDRLREWEGPFDWINGRDLAADADQQLASKDAEIARLKIAEANAAAGWDALRAENASLQAALVMAREYVESASRKRWDGTNNHKRAQLHLEALDHALTARKKG